MGVDLYKDLLPDLGVDVKELLKNAKPSKRSQSPGVTELRTDIPGLCLETYSRLEF